MNAVFKCTHVCDGHKILFLQKWEDVGLVIAVNTEF